MLKRFSVILVPLAAATAWWACGDDDASPGAVAGTDAGGTITPNRPPGPDAGSGDDDTADPGSPDGAIPDAGVDGCASTPCVVDLAGGTDQMCALLSDRTVRCWGGNAVGESGQPLTSVDGGPGGANILRPEAVTLGGTAKQVVAGWAHACALLDSGDVWCWGSNTYGIMTTAPDGGGTQPRAPAVVNLGGPASALYAGGYHMCARLVSGSVVCWGQNDDGQVGVNLDAGKVIATPAVVTGLAAATQIDLGGRFTCGLFAGSVSCLGDDSDGQLGRGTPAPGGRDANLAAVAIQPGDTIQLARSHAYSEGVLQHHDGGVLGWGNDVSAELGAAYPDAGIHVRTPVVIPGIDDAVELQFADNLTCARRASGTVSCWGATTHGGAGLFPDAGALRITPYDVTGITNAIRLELGWNQFGCALIAGGTVSCWGNNAAGDLGRNIPPATLPSDPVPAPVAF